MRLKHRYHFFVTPCRNEPEDGDITSLHAKRNLITASHPRKGTSRESIALIGKVKPQRSISLVFQKRKSVKVSMRVYNII